jgi:hypothetical protein
MIASYDALAQRSAYDRSSLNVGTDWHLLEPHPKLGSVGMFGFVLSYIARENG